jgi:uncharacterized membrane protein
MGHRLLNGLILLSALGCGVVGGVFFAFSSFVITALARLPAPHGIAAMQFINITVINPLFMGAFLGTSVACAILVVAALFNWSEPRAAWLLAGGLFYLVGALFVTIAFNVPRNEALAALDPNSADAATFWAGYVKGWTARNHVRTGAALIAAVCLMIALR